MIGPKLDARSYTNLILVVIALLLAINLIAQPQPRTSLYTADAEATQQVAAAVNQVAASNQQIAQALNRVADSIKEIANQMSRSAMMHPGSMAPSSSSAPDSGASAPRYEGSIQVQK